MSSYFHSASQSSPLITFCKLHVKFTPVSFIFAAIAQVRINLHRQHIMSFIQWWCERGSKSHVAKEISGRGRRRSRDDKGNQGVGDLRFTNILQLFSIYFFQLLYLILFFYTFFTHDIYPHPRPTTPIHYLRPTTFSYTPTRWMRPRRTVTCVWFDFGSEIFLALIAL